jgi:hypothetical protein
VVAFAGIILYQAAFKHLFCLILKNQQADEDCKYKLFSKQGIYSAAAVA